MFIVAKNGAAQVESLYPECARKIASGNVFIGRQHFTVDVKDKFEHVALKKGAEKSTVGFESEYDFGEVISLVGVATTSDVIVVKGRDYLFQPMVEEFTLSDTTDVVGKKAFKYVDEVKTKTGVATADVKIKTVNKIGLEFQTAEVEKSITNGVVDGTAVTLTDFTHTQTATSNDVRGIVDLSGKTVGDQIELFLILTEYCTKKDGVDEKGGLFGVPQFRE